MSGLVTSGEKRLVLVSGRAHLDLARQVGEELGCGVSPTTNYDFANGEIYVRFNESVRGADVFVLQSHTTPLNKWLMEQLIMVDAAKRARPLRGVDHDELLHQPLVERRRVGLEDEDVGAAHGLVEAHVDLAVGEVVVGRRRDAAPQLLAHLTGQVQVRASRHQNQPLLSAGHQAAHSGASFRSPRRPGESAGPGQIPADDAERRPHRIRRQRGPGTPGLRAGRRSPVLTRWCAPPWG